MQNSTTENWPYLRLCLPESADSEQIGRLSQVAADVGALGAMIENQSLLLYLPQEVDEFFVQVVRQAVQDEAKVLNWAPLAWQLESIADQPWATAWKKDFKSIAIGQSLLIRPDWEQHEPPAPEHFERHVVWLRPGFGFGTGRHETTCLALGLLENHLEPGARVLDFGSGSGILSIAAIRLGACSVTAIDFDPDANQNALENFELNGCAARIYLHESNSTEDAPGQFDLIICNMLSHNALPHFKSLAEHLISPEAIFIYTGFLLEQQREIGQALRDAGLVTQGFAQMNEWGAIVAECSHACHAAHARI